MKRLALAAIFCATIAAHAADKPLVAITQIVSHPSLNLIKDGIIDELADAGFKDGETIKVDYQIAQGDPSIAVQIAKQFAGKKPAVIVAITTPSAQTVAASSRDTPVVFAAVTDPIAAKLVDSLEKPGKNVTGTANSVPVDRSLDSILEILPEAKRIGYLYNPGEVNSVATLKTLQSEAEKRGLTVIERAVNKSADALDAAQSLVGKADAIWIGMDNTVVSALEAVIRVAERNHLPLFTADVESVARGSLAAIGHNSYKDGRQTGVMVAKVLKGTAPADIPVEDGITFGYVINVEAAKKMGVNIPPEVLKKADRLIGTP
ncbi:MAG: ABC transporter substrate-binding protein [Cardiobacteriaceae bacterium]|nr:ABC transporter substrate-binding protein [Cardiobacteriaceae bacterium]